MCRRACVRVCAGLYLGGALRYLMVYKSKKPSVGEDAVCCLETTRRLNAGGLAGGRVSLDSCVSLY